MRWMPCKFLALDMFEVELDAYHHDKEYENWIFVFDVQRFARVKAKLAFGESSDFISSNNFHYWYCAHCVSIKNFTWRHMLTVKASNLMTDLYICLFVRF